MAAVEDEHKGQTGKLQIPLKSLLLRYFTYDNFDFEKAEEKKIDNEKLNTKFSELSDFEKMPTKYPRVLVIGEPGAGKSALGNRLSGIEYHYKGKKRSTKRKIVTESKEIFESRASEHSVTVKLAYSLIDDCHTTENDKIIYIDTPGINEANDELREKMENDFREKLNAMKYVDFILILLKPYFLGPQTRPASSRYLKDTMKTIGDIFGGNKHLYGNVGIGISGCDPCDWSWAQEIKPNMVSLQKFLKKELAPSGSELDKNFQFPMFTLSILPNEGNDSDSDSDVDSEEDCEWFDLNGQFDKLSDSWVECCENPLFTFETQLMNNFKKIIDETFRKGDYASKKEAILQMERMVDEKEKELLKIYDDNIKHLVSVPKGLREGYKVWQAAKKPSVQNSKLDYLYLPFCGAWNWMSFGFKKTVDINQKIGQIQCEKMQQRYKDMFETILKGDNEKLVDLATDDVSEILCLSPSRIQNQS